MTEIPSSSKIDFNKCRIEIAATLSMLNMRPLKMETEHFENT